jgi:hypothetical protein
MRSDEMSRRNFTGTSRVKEEPHAAIEAALDAAPEVAGFAAAPGVNGELTGAAAVDGPPGDPPTPAADSSGPASGLRIAPGPEAPTTDGLPPDGDSPVRRLLAGARRPRNYKQEGARTARQLEIPLKHAPYPKMPFRAWPNIDEYFEGYILRPATDGTRKDLFIVDTEIAALPHVMTKVRECECIVCITSLKKMFVWARSLSTGTGRGGDLVFGALEQVAAMAREGWVSIDWTDNGLVVETPKAPIAEPKWPDQSLDEIYFLAFKDALITTPDHPEIQRLETTVVQSFDFRIGKG